MSADNEFTSPISASAVKKGAYIMMKGHPCKVASCTFSKTGKHGHMKAHITGICCITKRKYELSVPGHLTLQEVAVTTEKFQLSFVSEESDEIHLLNEEGELLSFKFVENDEKKALIEAKEADEADELDFTVTVASAPMSRGDENGQLDLCHAITAFKSEKTA